MIFSMTRSREIVSLAAPIAGIQLAQVALTSTDLLMMGMLGVKAVAAGGLALLLYNQVRTMCVGMLTGLGNLIATAAGQAEQRNGNEQLDAAAIATIHDLMRSALALATLVALLAALVLVGIGQCLPWLGQTAAVTAWAQPILWTLSPGLLAMLWLNVLRQFGVGMRRPGSLLRVTLYSIVVNAALNALFILGWHGHLRWGLAGIGLATTLVQLWTAAVYWRRLRRDALLRPLLAVDIWHARPATLLQIAKMGVPISLTYGCEAAITSIATLLMGTFGPLALAASNIVNQLADIVYQLNIGLSHGSSILISRLRGRGDLTLLRPLAINTLMISGGLMTAIGLLYLCLPRLVLAPFIDATASPALMATATPLLGFAVVHQYTKGSQNICIGLMRGLGNTRAGLSSTLIGYWVIGIPCMLVLAYPMKLQGNGVWAGLCIGFATTSLLLWRRFWRESQRVATEKP